MGNDMYIYVIHFYVFSEVSLSITPSIIFPFYWFIIDFG